MSKIGKANIKARKKIGEYCEEHNLQYCELRFDGCMGTFGIAPAHKNFRGWYKGDWERLADPNQWVLGCQHCHQILDDRSKTTKEESDNIFKKLRS